jgi:signal peptidase I
VPYIKRLIGKPGDTVRYINKKIYVNGESIKQEFISSSDGETLLRETFEGSERVIRILRGSTSYPEEFIVPPNHYFVMGDNRDNSSDSRYFGFVPKKNFMGTGELIWMTWECWTCVPSFHRSGLIK